MLANTSLISSGSNANPFSSATGSNSADNNTDEH
jgi:hypothetical protein